MQTSSLLFGLAVFRTVSLTNQTFQCLPFLGLPDQKSPKRVTATGEFGEESCCYCGLLDGIYGID